MVSKGGEIKELSWIKENLYGMQLTQERLILSIKLLQLVLVEDLENAQAVVRCQPILNGQTDNSFDDKH